MSDYEENSLPAIIGEKSLIQAQTISREGKLDEHIDADAEIANTMLSALDSGFKQAKTIVQLCKLIDTTMNVLEKRRKLLLRPYAADNQITGRTPVFPLS